MSRTLVAPGLILSVIGRIHAEPLPAVEKVAAQPLLAHVRQVQEALDALGNPLPQAAAAAIDQISRPARSRAATP